MYLYLQSQNPQHLSAELPQYPPAILLATPPHRNFTESQSGCVRHMLNSSVFFFLFCLFFTIFNNINQNNKKAKEQQQNIKPNILT